MKQHEQEKHNTEWTLESIKNAFERHGYAKQHFAQDYGCYPSAVTQFFQGRTTSAEMLKTATFAAKLLERRANG